MIAGKHKSITQQIRKKLYNTTTVDDYFQTFTNLYLSYLNIKNDTPVEYIKARVLDYTKLIRKTRIDCDVLSVMNMFTKKQWQIHRDRLK